MKKDELRNFRSYRIYKYVASALIVSMATFLQYMCWPLVSPAPFLFYYPAVIFACLYGDGISAIILSLMLSHYFFTPPSFTFSFDKSDLFRQFIFFSSSLLVRYIVKKEVETKLKAEAVVESLQEEKEIREKFVSTLTHDLKTPLTAVKLSAQMLLRADNKESFKTFSEKLLHNLERIELMIRDLLDTNSIRAGKPLPLIIINMDMVSVVTGTINDMTSVHGERFKLKAPDELQGYWCVEAVRRILENLSINAIKYGKENGPVTITVVQTDDSVELKVHNEGNPLTEEERSKLFKPFERARSARKSGKQGWGLGLTLVKGLTESMGGNVSVESTLGDGTTFIVTLPMDARQYAVDKELRE